MAPLIVVVGAFFSPRVAELWDITHSILGDVAVNTAVVAGGVGVCTLVLGTALAGLVTFYDFPVGGGSTGRSSYRWRSRRTFSFVYLGRFGPESELPLRSPGVRSRCSAWRLIRTSTCWPGQLAASRAT